MAIARSLERYITREGFDFDIVVHPHTMSSMETAQAAHIPGDALAKAVILEDEDGYLMAVIPATHHVNLGMLRKDLGRPLRLAAERDIAHIFDDCVAGAIPPIGRIYGLPSVVDEALSERSDIYIEAGNHEELVHLDGGEFGTLFSGARRGCFSHHV
ncbi:MAG: YbaK/EbsC family protein [Gammaproteobacteria bacterium]|nr:YbaK/EbsC family protein [Gammaproteobacteria bacterium]